MGQLICTVTTRDRDDLMGRDLNSGKIERSEMHRQRKRRSIALSSSRPLLLGVSMVSQRIDMLVKFVIPSQKTPLGPEGPRADGLYPVNLEAR